MGVNILGMGLHNYGTLTLTSNWRQDLIDTNKHGTALATKYFLCATVKKNMFSLERDTISPIKSQVSNIFISNDFPQSGEERLYKSFHFPIWSDPFVRRAIYTITDIFGTLLTEGQIENFERTWA